MPQNFLINVATFSAFFLKIYLLILSSKLTGLFGWLFLVCNVASEREQRKLVFILPSVSNIALELNTLGRVLQAEIDFPDAFKNFVLKLKCKGTIFFWIVQGFFHIFSKKVWGFPLFHFSTSDINILEELEAEGLYYIYYIII